MKYLCAQPATQYFGWQLDVMLHSFVNVGIDLNDVYVTCAIQGSISPYFNELKKKYPNVIFSFYKDERKDKTYISSIRPHILKKLFIDFPELSEETIFYHDCDIAFTRPLRLGKKLDDNICYLSDTVSYIGYEYINSKGYGALDMMCNIVGIDKNVVKENQANSGGAQYIIKNIDHTFWENVEMHSTKLFKDVTNLNKSIASINKASKEEYNPLQIWCADMWAVLWNIWKLGKETKVIKELDFSWAVTNASSWHKNAIFHNAGVTSDKEGLFYKGKYINDLPDLNLLIKKDTCSHNYYRLMQQAL